MGGSIRKLGTLAKVSQTKKGCGAPVFPGPCWVCDRPTALAMGFKSSGIHKKAGWGGWSISLVICRLLKRPGDRRRINNSNHHEKRRFLVFFVCSLPLPHLPSFSSPPPNPPSPPLPSSSSFSPSPPSLPLFLLNTLSFLLNTLSFPLSLS